MSQALDSRWVAYLPPFLRSRIVGRANLQKILSNTGWLFFDKIWRLGVGLFVSVWVARYLGPDQFGAFNFAVAFSALFSAFATLGLDTIVIRDIVREPDRKFEILSSAFVLKIGGGCFAFLNALIAIFILRPADNEVHWLVGIIAAGMIFQSFDTIDLWFQSQVKSKYTVLSKNGAFTVLAFVRVFLILYKAPLIAFAYAALAEIIVGAAGLVLFYLNQNTFLVWSPRKDTAKMLLKESWPAILSGLAIMIYMRIDQIMLAQIVGNKEVGLYSAALRFSEIWYFIPTAVVSSVMPSLTHCKQQSEELYLKKNQQLFKTLVRAAYLIALPMTFIATFLMTFFYGNAYAGAGTILAIHIWAAVFVFIGVGMTPWIANERLFKYSLFQTIAGAIVNVLLNIFLIPRWGAVGSAVATVISYGLAAYLSNAFFKKTYTIFVFQTKALLQVKL